MLGIIQDPMPAQIAANVTKPTKTTILEGFRIPIRRMTFQADEPFK
jgi:hypothetical protein